MLAKALSHYFEAKLLLLDVPDFSMKVNMISRMFFRVQFLISNSCNGIYLQMQSKYGTSKKDAVSNIVLPTFTLCVTNFLSTTKGLLPLALTPFGLHGSREVVRVQVGKKLHTHINQKKFRVSI